MSILRERDEFFTIEGVNTPLNQRTIDQLELAIRKERPDLMDKDLDREVFSISSPAVMSFGPLLTYDGSFDYERRTGHFPKYPGERPINGDRPGFILPREYFLFYENNNGVLHLFDPTQKYIKIKNADYKEEDIYPSDLTDKYNNNDMVTWTPRHPR